MSDESSARYTVEELRLIPNIPDVSQRVFRAGEVHAPYGEVIAMGVEGPGLYTVVFDKGALNIVSQGWTAFIWKKRIEQPLIIVPEMIPPSDINAP